MTISTVDQDGYPDARVLILKNVIDEAFFFASSSESRKGRQLEDNPHVALTFYWPALGRQVRIRAQPRIWEMKQEQMTSGNARLEPERLP